MSKPTFSTPSLAVAFFASAGGKALLSAALDMRAALAHLDEGSDDPDASTAKARFDDLADLLSEAGVSVVIAPGRRDDESPEDRARRLGYQVEIIGEIGPDGGAAFVYIRPNGEADSERFPSEAAAWAAAADDAALWVMDHGDDEEDDPAPPQPSPFVRAHNALQNQVEAAGYRIEPGAGPVPTSYAVTAPDGRAVGSYPFKVEAVRAADADRKAAPPRETVMTDFERDTVANLASVYGLGVVIEAAGRGELRPFHTAADLLGVHPDLLAGVLDSGATSESSVAVVTPDEGDREEIREGVRALRAAIARYKAEGGTNA